MKKNLVLLGMMGVGKTTFGKIVAKKLELSFFDTDNLIEKKNSMSVKKIFEKKGESFFRKEEEEITLKCLKKSSCVIALGGGAFLNKKIRNLVLLNSVSIWLKASILKLSLRLAKNSKRPLLKEKNNLKTLQQLYSSRISIYKLANYEIDCDKVSFKKIIEKILKIYEIY